MRYIYLVSGLSGAGKDTVADILQRRRYGMVNVKFSQPMKDAFERWLDLTPGFLNTPGRSDNVENLVTGELENFTYHDLMVRAWKSWREIYPWLTIGHVYQNCALRLAEPGANSLIFTDVRNPEELEVVRKLSKEFNTPIVHICLLGRGEEKESDPFFWVLKKEAFTYYFTLDNCRGLEELENDILQILNLLPS